MKSVVAIQHIAFENLGSFESVLIEKGYTVQYVPAWSAGLAERVRAGAPDLLVVLGGPIGVYEGEDYPFLRDEVELLAQRLAAGQATLGICLGAQLMAAALGASVYSSGAKEIGWSPLTLSAAGQDSALRFLSSAGTEVLHWHGDTFSLPKGAIHLASTAACHNQAFAYGAHALGLQFHAEVLGEHIEHWLVGHASEIGQADEVEVRVLRRDTVRHGAALQAQARQFFSAWLAQALPA